MVGHLTNSGGLSRSSRSTSEQVGFEGFTLRVNDLALVENNMRTMVSGAPICAFSHQQHQKANTCYGFKEDSKSMTLQDDMFSLLTFSFVTVPSAAGAAGSIPGVNETKRFWV